MPGIEGLDALGRPHTTHLLRRIDCRVEKGPEPGHEEHHFRGDEHDHAEAQVQLHDRGVVALEIGRAHV